MSLSSTRLAVVVLVATHLGTAVLAQPLPEIDSIAGKLERHDGFFTVYWDAEKGKVWMEIARLGDDFLYVGSLAAGLGSNDVGLDRGQLGRRRVVRFERVGPRVFLVVPNVGYRADGAGEAEARAVRDAFASGTDWAFEVAAESDGRLLVDATDFLVRDIHGVELALDRAGQGQYALDATRSTPLPDAIRSFPDNTELEVSLTFALQTPGRSNAQPGAFVRDVASSAESITVRVRHSLIRLPEPGYAPRENHARSGFYGVEYRDYAAPIGSDMTVRLLSRHRLQKVNPAAPVSPVVEPIIYYLDPGTPEPVRSALLEGASWWADAFEAAGFLNAFRVEILPEDADPLDVRYNVIQWVHRVTRGWSYGSSVVDPRTGEIIKGHVSLGSLRVRQDYLLAEGLLAPYEGDRSEGFAPEDDPTLAMALARIRQLSAHEVGHTLGLMHNFAASTYGRASVMDYPAPLVDLDEGGLSLERAYDNGVGAWDRWAIRFGYGEPPPGTPVPTYLRALLDEATSEGLLYLTDSDSRATGTMQPSGNLWDNGTDPVTELRRVMQVRAHALSRFSESVIRNGRPLATMEEVLVPLYLHHRYQLDAAAKSLGGMMYEHSVRGEGAGPMQVVDARMQREALAEMLNTLTPAALRLPPGLRASIRPRPPGYAATRELFNGDASPAFDPYVPAEVLATLVFDLILHPDRAARLVHQRDFSPELPGLLEVMTTVADRVWKSAVAENAYDAEIQRTVQQVWVDALIEASGQASGSAAVRARAVWALADLASWIAGHPGSDGETRAHRSFMKMEIDRYLELGQVAAINDTRVTIPPGAPIGSYEEPAVLRMRVRREAVARRTASDSDCLVPGSER